MNKLPPLSRPSSQKSLNSINEFQPRDNLGHSKTTKNLINFKSPFKIPQDDEVFQYCEQERVKKEERKKDIQELNIWDIKTATCRNALKHYKNFQAPIDEKHVTQKAYTEHERGLISQALDIANERKKNKDKIKEKKESIVQVIEQKKEMFLVTKAYGNIEKEIERLQMISQDREKALDQSERLLQQDMEHFNQYTENYKREQEHLEKMAETASKERKEIEAQIKSVQVKQTSLKSEKTRLEEALQVYQEHKEFLDKLAPKDWSDQKEQALQAKIEECRKIWKQQYKDKYYKEKKKQGKSDNEIEDPFLQKIKNNEIPEIVEFEDNYPIAFTDPKQLIDCFEKLQQDQLNAIKIKQEDEQYIEEIKKEKQRNEIVLEKKVHDLKIQQEIIQRQIEDVKNQIRDMKVKSTSSSSLGTHIEMIGKEAQIIYNMFNTDGNQQDNVELHTTQYLSKIEFHIEQSLRELDYYYQLAEQKNDNRIIKTINEQRKQSERDRKVKFRELQKIKNYQEQMQKNQKNKDKMHEKSQKRIGRIDMRRSDPLYEEIKEEKQVVDNEEEEDKKYFQQDYVMCVDKEQFL